MTDSLMHDTAKGRIAELQQRLLNTSILGDGPHAILEGLRILRDTEADFACTGEWEYFIIEPLEALGGKREFSTIKDSYTVIATMRL